MAQLTLLGSVACAARDSWMQFWANDALHPTVEARAKDQLRATTRQQLFIGVLSRYGYLSGSTSYDTPRDRAALAEHVTLHGKMADSSRDQADLPSTSTSDQDAGEKRILAQFKSEDGELVATPFDLPIDVTQEGLQLLCNAALQNVSLSDGSTERNVPLCTCLSLATCISYSCLSMHPHQHTQRDWTERHNYRK